MLDIYKFIILAIAFHAVVLAKRDNWGNSYRWLGIDMVLIIIGVFALGM